MSSDTTRAERNRKNALASTGPKTLEGKEKSSANHLSHGLRSKREVIPGECPEEWSAFVANVAGDLNAATPTEQSLAHLVASSLWRLGRGSRFEADAANRAVSRNVLTAEYDKLVAEIPFLIRQATGQIDSEALRDLEKGIRKQENTLTHYRNTLEIIGKLPVIPEDFAVDMKYPMELASLAGIAPEEAEVILLESGATAETGATPAQIRDLFKLATEEEWKGVYEHLKERLAEQEKKVSNLKENLKRKQTHYEEELEKFAASRAIPSGADLERLQTYEAHLHRNLQRSLEAYAKLREIRSLPPAPIVVEAVASNVKKRGRS
jgi:hypothetical protein